MAGQYDFSISTEGLDEKGREIAKETQKIKDALTAIESATKKLDGWVSANKSRYTDKVASLMPQMREMTEVLDSYSGVAVQTSARAEETENSIARRIENEFMG